jgi:hypothetical protein
MQDKRFLRKANVLLSDTRSLTEPNGFKYSHLPYHEKQSDQSVLRECNCLLRECEVCLPEYRHREPRSTT